MSQEENEMQVESKSVDSDDEVLGDDSIIAKTQFNEQRAFDLKIFHLCYVL